MSKKEICLLILGLSGLLALYWVEPAKWWRVALFNCFAAFAFEASMEPLYDYSQDLRTSRCIAKTDVNFLFALAWNFMFSMILLLSGWIGSSVWAFALCGFLIGNIMEIAFFRAGFWAYNYDARYLNLYRPFRPKITVAGVPIQIMLAYGMVVGPFVWVVENKIIL